jgi:hypothetical protein
MREAAAALARAARSVGLDPAEIASPEPRVGSPSLAGHVDAFDEEFGEAFEHAEIAAFDTRTPFDVEREAGEEPAALPGAGGQPDAGGQRLAAEGPAGPFDIEREAWAA